MKKDTLKINNLDIDTWIDRDKEEIVQSPVDETTLRYDYMLVAFLDLLGITNLILGANDGEESEIIARLEKIKSIVSNEADEHIKLNQLNLLHLSDSFIFACTEDLLPAMLDLLSIIQMRILIECHTMLRGALEFGPVIIRDEGRQIIGPAYINAYQRQENDAIYPRIIISNNVFELINNKFKNYSSIIMTYDMENALDFVEAYRSRESKKSSIISQLKREGVYDFLIDEYNTFNKKQKCSICRKYGWIITYLQEKKVWPNEAKYNNWK